MEHTCVARDRLKARVIEAFARRKEVYRIDLFGGEVAGTVDEFSDIDLIVSSRNPAKTHNQNINIHVPSAVQNDHYLLQVKTALEERVKTFVPEIIFWNWGYDGTIGEYGDIGLTAQLHVQLAQEIKRFAIEICNGRLVVILCGGSRRDLAASIIPRILEVLANK